MELIGYKMDVYTILFVGLLLGTVNSKGLYSTEQTHDMTSGKSIEERWAEILRIVYEKAEKSIGFCFGRDPEGILRLINESFHWPETARWARASPGQHETGPGDFGVCSNISSMAGHLCGPEEVEIYYRFMLLTSDPEKVPSTMRCPAGASSLFCAPGFFGVQLEAKRMEAAPCCPGFFCPRNLACMMPCPQGAYCPRGFPAPPPDPFRHPFETETPIDGHERDTVWCAPYAYKKRDGLSCGGADQWTIIPQDAFPGTSWKYGSGSIYCPKGFYCNATTRATLCPRGYFCRQGSENPERCPPGAFCPAGTEVPLNNYGGVSADLLLLFLVSALWMASWQYNDIMSRVGHDEKIEVQWKPWPKLRITRQSHYLAEYDIHHPDIARTNNSAIGLGSLQRTVGLDIAFLHLTMRLRGGTRKVILTDASGRFPSSKVTAILGPSGAGKSSLLSLLAGRAAYSRAQGTVLIDGKEMNVSTHKHSIGFVPQDDIVYAELTVSENLMFAARFGMDRSSNWSSHKKSVNDVINILGLEDVRNVVVGNQKVRGISGGQRKRVNVGIELVSDPSVLFLDEPTSGLDSSAAYLLMKRLRKIAHDSYVTVAAVLHQPRHEAFSLCDFLLLLAAGGRTVYFGKTADVENYFQSIGHPLPYIHTNPADFILDILSQDLVESSHPVEPILQQLESDFPEVSFANHFMSRQDLQDSPSVGVLLGGSSDDEEFHETIQTQADSHGSSDRISKGSRRWIFVDAAVIFLASVGYYARKVAYKLHIARPSKVKYGSSGHLHESLLQEDQVRVTHVSTKHRPPSIFHQFYWFLQRAALCRSREPLQAFTDYSIIVLTGLTVGLLSDRGRATIMSYASQVSYNVVALGLISMVSAVSTFTAHAVYFRREASSGVNRLAYFLALDVFDVLGSSIKSLAYLGIWSSFASPRGALWQLYIVMLAQFYSCSGIAYFLSLVLGHNSSQLAAAVITLITTLASRQTEASAFLRHIQYFCYPRWALEGLMIAENDQLKGVWLLARCADLSKLGYDVRRFALCIINLVIIGVITRALALSRLLYTSSRNRA